MAVQARSEGVGEGVSREVLKVHPGQLVSSRAGRDRGVFYLVTRVLNGRMVLVADGGTRTVAAPKRKNISHLILHQAAVPEELRNRLERGERVDDAEIRQAVTAMRASGKGEPG